MDIAYGDDTRQLLAGMIRNANGHSPPECSLWSGLDVLAFCGSDGESIVTHTIEFFRNVFHLPKFR